MNLNRLADILGLIVATATVSVIVGSPNTRGIITAFADGFSGALRAAKS